MNQELNWTKRKILVGPPSRRRTSVVWQCEHEGAVWTIKETPRDVNGCKSFAVDRYLSGMRTRFALMPSLKSAGDAVVRFVNDP